LQFLTDPVIPSSMAFSRVCFRKNTPCTRPWTLMWLDTKLVIGYWLLVIGFLIAIGRLMFVRKFDGSYDRMFYCSIERNNVTFN
jgi:hypothetical protein